MNVVEEFLGKYNAHIMVLVKSTTIGKAVHIL